MSDDPETARQIAELASDDRPLLVLDVDDVILDFVEPLPRYLSSRGFDLALDTFRLHGNVREQGSGRVIERPELAALMNDFWGTQHDWQTIAAGAADTIAHFAPNCEIVLLTAMPHRHRQIRRTLLERFGLAYPLVTTEKPKGPAVRLLRGATPRPVAFVDDMPGNLVSVREAVPNAHLFHFSADNAVRDLMPETPAGAIRVSSWSEAAPLIAGALGL